MAKARAEANREIWYALKRQIVGLREPAAGSMTRTEEERKAR